jgi:hypothetical protein
MASEPARPVSGKAEREFCRLIATAAMGMGLLVHWCPDSRRCVGRRGFPDLVIAGPHAVIFREVKMADGDPSPDQDLWGWILSSDAASRMILPLRWEIWRPSDWDSGKIGGQLLKVLAGPGLAGD